MVDVLCSSTETTELGTLFGVFVNVDAFEAPDALLGSCRLCLVSYYIPCLLFCGRHYLTLDACSRCFHLLKVLLFLLDQSLELFVLVLHTDLGKHLHVFVLV